MHAHWHRAQDMQRAPRVMHFSAFHFYSRADKSSLSIYGKVNSQCECTIVVSTADFSLYISGAGCHHTEMFAQVAVA